MYGYNKVVLHMVGIHDAQRRITSTRSSARAATPLGKACTYQEGPETLQPVLWRRLVVSFRLDGVQACHKVHVRWLDYRHLDHEFGPKVENREENAATAGSVMPVEPTSMRHAQGYVVSDEGSRVPVPLKEHSPPAELH